MKYNLDDICLYTYAVMKYQFYFYFLMEEGACEGKSSQGPQNMCCNLRFRMGSEQVRGLCIAGEALECVARAGAGVSSGTK